MAPEQARRQCERIDPRTDVYGLGGVLYALLTGQPPHPGATLDEQLAHTRQGDVTPPRTLKPSIPRRLERIVLTALAADPARRYASAAELRRALRRYRRRPLYRAAAGLVFLFVLAVQALAWPRPWSSPPDQSVVAITPIQAPASPLPVRIEWMELEHSREDESLGTIGMDDSSACLFDDEIHIRARLNAPAYFYLIALHPTGDIELYYPEGESEEAAEATPPPLSHDLSYPSDPLGKDLKSPLTDGVGLQAFVLVASRKPLPPYSEWKKARLGNLPWAATKAEGVWHYDGQRSRGSPSGGAARARVPMPHPRRSPRPAPHWPRSGTSRPSTPGRSPSYPRTKPSHRRPTVRRSRNRVVRKCIPPHHIMTRQSTR
jgi:hypothetical protein